MKRICFNIDEELHQVLKIGAAKRRISMTALITRALRQLHFLEIKEYEMNRPVDNKK